MTTIQHAVLGEIDFDDAGFGEASVEFAGRDVQVDLNFDEEVPKDVPASAVRFVSELARLDTAAKAALAADLAESSDGDVASYIEHHMTELKASDLAASVGKPVDRTSFVANMYLTRIGLYPDRDDVAAVFDYTISEDLTDYLLVVSFNAKAEVDSIAMES